jgi:DNA replication licensing factor MCM2
VFPIFKVSYRDLSEHSPILAIWLADAPKAMLQIFDEVANEVVVTAEHFPEYRRIVDEIHVRISELPISDKLRELRQSHLNAIVKVQGVVTRRSAVFPQLKEATYNCVSCGYLSLPFRQTGTGEMKPSNCISCQV